MFQIINQDLFQPMSQDIIIMKLLIKELIIHHLLKIIYLNPKSIYLNLKFDIQPPQVQTQMNPSQQPGYAQQNNYPPLQQPNYPPQQPGYEQQQPPNQLLNDILSNK